MKISIFISKIEGMIRLLKIARFDKRRDTWYIFPLEDQPAIKHSDLLAIEKVKTRVAEMVRTTATINLVLPEALYAKYLDDDHLNFLFNSKPLVEENENSEDEKENSEDMDLIKLQIEYLKLQLELNKTPVNNNFRNVSAIEREDREINLEKIERKMNVSKFEPPADAADFMQDFEAECKKFQVVKDDDKLVLLKNCLSPAVIEWYYATKKRCDLKFSIFKEKFLKVYDSKGWQSSRKAIEFKYMGGKYLDYAVKKEKLLVEDEKAISESMLIKLIVSGLPNRVSEKLDKTKCKTVEDVLASLSILDSDFIKPVVKLSNENKNHVTKQQVKPIREKPSVTSCTNCKRTNHSTKDCWYTKRQVNLIEESSDEQEPTEEQEDEREEEFLQLNMIDKGDFHPARNEESH